MMCVDRSDVGDLSVVLCCVGLGWVGLGGGLCVYCVCVVLCSTV